MGNQKVLQESRLGTGCTIAACARVRACEQHVGVQQAVQLWRRGLDRLPDGLGKPCLLHANICRSKGAGAEVEILIQSASHAAAPCRDAPLGWNSTSGTMKRSLLTTRT